MIRERNTHAASPEKVPSVFQHGININKLTLSDGDEPTISRVVVMYCTSY